MEFFQQYANMHPIYSMLYTANLGLCDYVLFLQIRSHIKLIHVLGKKYMQVGSYYIRTFHPT